MIDVLLLVAALTMGAAVALVVKLKAPRRPTTLTDLRERYAREISARNPDLADIDRRFAEDYRKLTGLPPET